jgi:hypothetical protein
MIRIRGSAHQMTDTSLCHAVRVLLPQRVNEEAAKSPDRYSHNRCFLPGAGAASLSGAIAVMGGGHDFFV